MSAPPDHANRFDALRLVFAGVVAAYHLVALAGLDIDGPLERSLAFLTELSIQGFFVVSGALVLASWERSRGVADYASKRARRLYPAYAVIILAPAIIAFGLTGAWRDVLAYLAPNLVFLNFVEPTLPSLFENNRFDAVNGALWTIKIEVMFYVLLPLLAWPLRRTGLAGALIWLAALYAVAIIWRVSVQNAGFEPGLSERLARQLPGQMSFFAAGMALHVLRRGFAAGRSRLLAAAGVAAFALSFMEPFSPLRAAGLASVIALAAYAPGPALPAARWGDVSYGVYLVHFPIIQALVAAGLFEQSPAAGSLIATGFVIGAAYALWHFIEKPALRRSSHYRRVSDASPSPPSSVKERSAE